tara:strand:+ start:13328 stop:17458 length:4131 start_codon:yes stop_codon:yes gene_type:complete
MEYIKRKISRGSLLGDRTNMRRSILNPEPLYSNGIYPYPCIDTNQSMDDCIESLYIDVNNDGIKDWFVIPPTWFGGNLVTDQYDDWEQDIDEKIIEIFNEFIADAFFDDFEMGTSKWYGGSEEYDTKLVWNQYSPYIVIPGNNNIRLEITDIIGGGIPNYGQLILQTPSVNPLLSASVMDPFSLNQGIDLSAGVNYRLSVNIMSRVRSHKDFIDDLTFTNPFQVQIMGIDMISQNLVVFDWSSEEIPYYPDRETITTTFTAPSGGKYWFTIVVNIPTGPTGVINMIGDFIQIDDFSISLENTTSGQNSFNSIKRKVFGLFKGFNILPSAYNIELYKHNIKGYLLNSDPIDVDDLPLGVYGSQTYDDLGNQVSYELTNPPLGVIPFYYLGYNLYGTITTNVQGNTLMNDGYLYCNGADLGPWDGVTNTYGVGDVVEDTSGSLWYCNPLLTGECNTCSPEDNCGWVKCLSLLAYGGGTLNINIPLYQDIKDMGIYRDIIHPGIAEECGGTVENLTKDYKCPVPYYIQDGGAVMFYDPLTTKEIIIKRPCCEDYSEYGFVWWNGKCYLDYGNDLQGQGKELFNFPYSTLFVGRGDNGRLYYDGGYQLTDQVFINSGGIGEIIQDSGERVLLYTPLVTDVIEGATYVFRANLLMEDYNSQTLSTIQLGATGQIDPNWGYVYFEDFSMGEDDDLQPGSTSCGGSTVIDAVVDGIYTIITDDAPGLAMNLVRMLEQNKTYRVRFGYVGLNLGGTSSPHYTPSVDNVISMFDLEVQISDYITSTTVIPIMTYGGSGIYDVEAIFTTPATSSYLIQLSVNNPQGPACPPSGDFYGYGLDYFAIDEMPYNYTTDDNTVITPRKVWSSNSFDSADGLQTIELESEITVRGAKNLSLRVICDIKEQIVNSPLTFNLVIKDLSLKYYQKPNFLGCKPTHFLNEVSNTFTTEISTAVPTISGTYDFMDPTIPGAITQVTFGSAYGAQGIQGNDIQTTSAPYVRPVFGTDHRIIPSGPKDTSAQCETSQFIVGWYCNLNYYIELNGVPIIQPDGTLGVRGCVGSPVMIPGVTMYSTAADCVAQSDCLDIIGCMNEDSTNFNPSATEPCFDLDNVPGNSYLCECAIYGTCIDPTSTLTNSQYSGLCFGDQNMCTDPLQCNSNWVPLLNGGHCCENEDVDWGCADMNSTNWAPNIELDAGELMCNYDPGCPDPTASNYLDAGNPNNCIPLVGPNGNVYSCTDCSANPPSAQWGVTAQSSNTLLGITAGQLLYPSAIIPGTLGDNSCCEFDDANDIPVGCTDISAANFNDPGNIDCATAISNGDPCFDNNTCIAGTIFEVWCCNYNAGSGTWGPVCEDYTLYNVGSYNALMNSAGGMCQDLIGDCVTYTPCVS